MVYHFDMYVLWVLFFIWVSQISSDELQEFPETTPEEMISLALAQWLDTPWRAMTGHGHESCLSRDFGCLLHQVGGSRKTTETVEILTLTF